MSPARKKTGGVWRFLTLEQLMTGSIIHLVYWAGLGVIFIAGFGVVGGAVGVAMRGEGWIETLLTIPVLVIGLIVVAAMALIWRSVCEFYVVVFQIGEDLRAMRRTVETEQSSTVRPVSPEIRDAGRSTLP